MKTKEEVLSILRTKPNGNIEEPQFKKKFPELYQELLTWEFPSDFKFTQKLYHYFNEDPELKLGLCPVCGKRCKFTKFNRGYIGHCSKECILKDPNVSKKRKETNIKKYGVEYTLQSEKVKQKIKETNIKRYGVENVFQSEEKKQKIKDTMKSRYGVEHPLQYDEFKEKAVATTQERYGVDNYSSLPECREKVKSTCREKYGKDWYPQTDESKQHLKEICNERYNADSPFQSEEIKQKIKEIMIEKYGTEHALQCDVFKEKAMNTCIERYGVYSYSKTQECLEKMQKTSQERYGVDNYSSLPECREKVKSTCRERYGVDNYVQTNDYFRNKTYHFFSDITNERYDSSWEQILAEYCFNNNIPYIYQPDIQFEYEYDGKVHHYQPDFLINGKIYEVKGDHFFDGDKMILPFNRNDYNYGLAEAKHQCMIKNNVIILRGDDIKKIKERIF